MTLTGRKLLAAFDALDSGDKREVTVEVLRRSSGSDDLADEAFDEMAAKLFRGYDAEESAGAHR